MLKLLQSALLASPLLIANTQACIRVHNYLNTDPVVGDVMVIQAWNNKELVCDGGARQYLASDETVWTVDCNEGYELRITANGRKGEIWDHPNNYHAELKGVASDQNKYCRYHTGINDRCAGYVFDYEYVLWDSHETCSDALNIKPCGQSKCDLPKDDGIVCTIGVIPGIGGGCE